MGYQRVDVWLEGDRELRDLVVLNADTIELPEEYIGTVIRNLERFPGMGRPFLARASRSVETSNALEALRAQLSALTPDPEALREYILADYLVLYARIDGLLYLLAIRHHRQISFDFESHWGEISL